MGTPFYHLAAAAVVIAAVVVAGAAAVAVTAAEEQDQQDDDPPAAGVVTKNTIVAHNEYLRDFLRLCCRSFHGIPATKKCADPQVCTFDYIAMYPRFTPGSASGS